MPRYDYICPSNGEVIEAEHSWAQRLSTWGELCRAAGRPAGTTPPDAPVERLIGLPRIVRTRPDEESPPTSAATETEEAPPIGRDARGGGMSAARPGLHPIGCPCCPPPLDPGILEFHRKLRQSRAREET